MINLSIFWSVLNSYIIQKQKEVYAQRNKNITFQNNGRSGFAILKDGNKITRFYTEVGGGDCIFYMVIPSAELWESQTGYTIGEKDDVVKYIAEESLKKQAKTQRCYYKIDETNIVFYQK